MKKYLIVLSILLVILVSGCGSGDTNISDDKNDTTVNYNISGKEAKEKNDRGAIIVDVRTVEEYNEGHIDGAILFPVASINAETVLNYLPDKNAEIIVYCRSGNRSHQALQKLKSLGYDNIYDLGSINNWEE